MKRTMHITVWSTPAIQNPKFDLGLGLYCSLCTNISLGS